MRRSPCGIVAAAAFLAGGPASSQPSSVTALQVKPSAADPRVEAFDDPSVVLIPKGSTAETPLVLFLTGTGGKPAYSIPFLEVIAGQGYRVVSLAYDDEPAVSQVCPKDPDPACSEDFRRMRIDGVGSSRTVSNPAAEGITTRLTALLHALEAGRPGEGWAGYSSGEQPDWSRIVVSGLSQGAGMAAYIAKGHETARVVLFSSPWDFTGAQRTPAPWLSRPSATPMDRWYAEYNARELTAPAIQRAYAALQIPADHIRVFSRDLPASFHGSSPNPYHVITIKDPAYADDWRAMFGHAP